MTIAAVVAAEVGEPLRCPVILLRCSACSQLGRERSRLVRVEQLVNQRLQWLLERECLASCTNNTTQHTASQHNSSAAQQQASIATTTFVTSRPEPQPQPSPPRHTTRHHDTTQRQRHYKHDNQFTLFLYHSTAGGRGDGVPQSEQ